MCLPCSENEWEPYLYGQIGTNYPHLWQLFTRTVRIQRFPRFGERTVQTKAERNSRHHLEDGWRSGCKEVQARPLLADISKIN